MPLKMMVYLFILKHYFCYLSADDVLKKRELKII